MLCKIVNALFFEVLMHPYSSRSFQKDQDYNMGQCGLGDFNMANKHSLIYMTNKIV
jgi:hypothetical protein